MRRSYLCRRYLALTLSSRHMIRTFACLVQRKVASEISVVLLHRNRISSDPFTAYCLDEADIGTDI